MSSEGSSFGREPSFSGEAPAREGGWCEVRAAERKQERE